MTIAALIAGHAALASEKTSKRVDIDGKTYRVTRSGDTVVVARKSFLVSYDIGERDAQRRAVLIATGCQIVDELPSTDARLRGKLQCPEAAAKPSKRQ